ncbi:PREDICTED: 28S ribosomal protein S29, mitochondrial [Lepidothrix coronata]|uniref:Small ribosomal subunit protein mS29 n=1 Tax=Lepidothrix coronata TaxID=321398 RepID=A0A6J0GPW8_9PASS|nr:PREDICTED: 28S ribosomal protein S29, mitochondrial [Lepidothrix coronata]
MLRSLKGLACRSLKLEQGYGLPTAAKECLSSVASQDVPTPQRPRAVFHTSESDPAKHTEQHEGRHYNIPLEEVKAVFPHGLPYRFQQQIQTFNEACVMVRRPALELFAYLRGTNLAQPVVRYVIYGERGTGKTMTLCHVVHFCSRQGWLVLHIPDGENSRVPSVPSPNTCCSGRCCSQGKLWAGATLSGFVSALPFFQSGGAVVTTLSQTGSLFKPSSAYLPQELLGKEGFDALDPFVPILVPNYSPREFESCYGYYLERKWLQHEQARTEDGKAELQFLSGSNPRQLDRLAGPL